MKNLIQAAVVTLFAASAAHAQQAVQWKVSDGGNGHWYRFVIDAGTFWDKQHQAVTRGGLDLHPIRGHTQAAGLHLPEGACFIATMRVCTRVLRESAVGMVLPLRLPPNRVQSAQSSRGIC